MMGSNGILKIPAMPIGSQPTQAPTQAPFFYLALLRYKSI
jgi:hypothetical protein